MTSALLMMFKAALEALHHHIPSQSYTHAGDAHARLQEPGVWAAGTRLQDPPNITLFPKTLMGMPANLIEVMLMWMPSLLFHVHILRRPLELDIPTNL